MDAYDSGLEVAKVVVDHRKELPVLGGYVVCPLILFAAVEQVGLVRVS